MVLLISCHRPAVNWLRTVDDPVTVVRVNQQAIPAMAAPRQWHGVFDDSFGCDVYIALDMVIRLSGAFWIAALVNKFLL